MVHPRCIALLLLFAIAGSGPAFAQQQQRFAAIAYSPSTQVIGVAADNATQAEAESVALSNCQTADQRPNDCRATSWTRNGCVVISIGEDGGWGVDWGPDINTAERKSLVVCGKYSKTCRAVRRVCTSKP